MPRLNFIKKNLPIVSTSLLRGAHVVSDVTYMVPTIHETTKVPAAVVVGGPCIAGPETITARGRLQNRCIFRYRYGSPRSANSVLLAMTVVDAILCGYGKLVALAPDYVLIYSVSIKYEDYTWITT